MKKILLLTDFTDNAKNAAQMAVNLCGKLHTNLVLYNTFIDQPVVPEYSGGSWVVEEVLWKEDSKKKLVFLKEDLEAITGRLPYGDRPPSIYCEQGEGNIGDNVRNVCQKMDIAMVVMGARSDSKIDHFLTGSATSSVINKSPRPVLVVPPESKIKALKKVTFATDFDDADLEAAHYLIQLAKVFDLQIQMVHVAVWGEKDEAIDERQKAFAKSLVKFKYPKIDFLRIAGKELISRLNTLCEEQDSDMLVLVHDRQTFINRLFEESNTKTLLKHQQIPVLIIPGLQTI